MKKSFLLIFFFVLCFKVFSLDIQMDFILEGLYNFTDIFSGSASYQKVVENDYFKVNGDYRALFTAAGGCLGYDMFVNSFPLGFYFRGGLLSVFGVNRTAGGKNVYLNNTEIEFNTFYDVGGVYAFNLDNYVSICVAPAFSMLFVNSEYRNLKSIYTSRATIDSLLGVGITADIFSKFRQKYFVATIGCATSFYPLSLVSSADSSINYSSNIYDTKAYNIRPYVSVGFTFKEHTALNISPAN